MGPGLIRSIVSTGIGRRSRLLATAFTSVRREPIPITTTLGTSEPSTSARTVAITNPTNNAVLAAPATFTFAADASDLDADGLSDVEFYIGPNLVDDVFSSPFETPVTDLAAGGYTLTVIAYDNVGATATNSITITVQNSGPITLTALKLAAGRFSFNASGLTAGKTNIVQVSTNLAFSAGWVSIATNVATGSSASFTNAVSGGRGFFRLLQQP